MKLTLNTLTHTTLVLFILIIPGLSYADYDEYGNSISNEYDSNRSEATRTIRTIKYKLTPKTIKNAVLHALLHYDWKIKMIGKQHIDAENSQAFISAEFKDTTSVALLLKSKSDSVVNAKWLNSIDKFVVKELSFHYYSQQFDQQENINQ